MAEVGDIRRAPDGTFEYLKTQGYSLRGGLVETWWPVATHAAMHMRLPEPYLANLKSAGYEGGPFLHDLLIAEGWRPPDKGYIELGTVRDSTVIDRPLPPRELEP